MTGIERWEVVQTPPDWALTKIKGGRLNGFTDIKPQWRYLVMTQEYGLCGIGWVYDITRTWTEPGAHDQVMVFVEIALRVKVDGEWSEPIPGIGGSTLTAKESRDLHSTDEAYKMAVTDALSVAMKMIGVGASVYYGAGEKYVNSTETAETESTAPALDAVTKAASKAGIKPAQLEIFASAVHEAPLWKLSVDDLRQVYREIEGGYVTKWIASQAESK